MADRTPDSPAGAISAPAVTSFPPAVTDGAPASPRGGAHAHGAGDGVGPRIQAPRSPGRAPVTPWQERYRSDEAWAEAQRLRARRSHRAARAREVAAYRRAARTRLGVVVGWRLHGVAYDALVVTERGVVQAKAIRADRPRKRPGRVPRAPVGLDDFVRVVTRAPGRARPGRTGSRVVHFAHALTSFTPAQGEALLALQRAWLWDHHLTDHDRDGTTVARHFAGLDLLLARAEADARRHRRLIQEQDGQDAEERTRTTP